MKCLILAAGRGSRIDEASDCKPLKLLLGLTLIERTIATANGVGLTDFYVVTGYNGQRVESYLSDFSQGRRDLTITTIRNEDWEKGNATSLLRARQLLDETFVLLMVDHVFDETILKALIHEPLQEDELILVTDYNINDNRFVDGNDVTKVLVEDHYIIDIGKHIKTYNAYDTGIFLCSPAIFAATEQSLQDSDASLAGGVHQMAKKGKARSFDIDGSHWIDINTSSDLKKAESMLYDSLVKPHDGFISRTINRKFSLRVFTPLLLRISNRITANQVSILSFVVALVGALCFFFQQAVLGGIIVQLASILDGCDGEIARLKKMQSSFGNFFDAALDRYSDSFILFGMFYYAWSSPENLALFGPFWNPLILGTSILAITGNLMVSYTSAKSVTDFGYRYRGGWIAAGRGRDLRLFTLFIGGILAWIHPLSVYLAILIVAILTNIIVLWRIKISWQHEHISTPLLDVTSKAIIFDFDGTIANTMPFLTDLAVKLIVENYEISKEEAQRKYIETTGMNFANQIEQIFPSHPQNHQVVATFEARKLDGIFDHPIFPEVIPTLTFFKDRRIKLFICSSTKAEIISEYAQKNKIALWLEDCLGYKPGFGKKIQIETILQQYDLKQEKVIFVGDSLRDYDFVQDKKINFIGIRRIFDEPAFQKRGLISVKDLGGLTRLWEQSERLLAHVEKVT